MVLSLKDKWIWDFWLARDGEDWHVFFLQADNTLAHPDMRHRNVTQGHAVGRDLKTWTHLGTTFAPAPPPAFDDWTTWTGSVVRGPEGRWHLFYTGTSRVAEGMHQRIGHATSDDLHHWRRVGDGLALDRTGPHADLYEEYTPGHWHDRAMRDPWVMRDPDGEGWIMVFTARVPGRSEPNAGGAIGFATSPDLDRWTLQPPVYTDGDFGQLEVPQLFEHRGRWYMLFCTAAEHWSQAYRARTPHPPVTGTHYLIGEGPRGPWRVAPGPFLDGADPCRRYAGRIVEVDGALKLMGFLYDDGAGGFVGRVSDPVAVEVDDEGLLHVREEGADG